MPTFYDQLPSAQGLGFWESLPSYQPVPQVSEEELRDQRLNDQFNQAMAKYQARMEKPRAWETPSNITAETIGPAREELMRFAPLPVRQFEAQRQDAERRFGMQQQAQGLDLKKAAEALQARERWKNMVQEGIASGMTPEAAARQAAILQPDIGGQLPATLYQPIRPPETERTDPVYLRGLQQRIDELEQNISGAQADPDYGDRVLRGRAPSVATLQQQLEVARRQLQQVAMPSPQQPMPSAPRQAAQAPAATASSPVIYFAKTPQEAANAPELRTQGRFQAGPQAPPREFKSPDDVQRALREGRIDRERAAAIMRGYWGMELEPATTSKLKRFRWDPDARTINPLGGP